MKRTIAALLIGAALVLSFASCYGSFQALKTVHRWNGSLGNPFLNTLVFWVFWIVPVYEVTALADAIVFNLLEFWTGENPIASVALKDGALAEFERVDDATVKMTVTQVDGTVGAFTIVKVDDRGFMIKGADGAVLSQVEVRDDGDLVLTAGGATRIIPFKSAEQIAAFGLSPAAAHGALR